MSRSSVRLRLTVFVSGVFLVTLVVAGWGVRTALEANLRDDAVANARVLLDEHLRLSADGIVDGRIEPDESPRLAYYDPDGEVLTWAEVDAALFSSFLAELEAAGPLLDEAGRPIDVQALTASDGIVSFSVTDPNGLAPGVEPIPEPDSALLDAPRVTDAFQEVSFVGVVRTADEPTVVDDGETLVVSQAVRIGDTDGSVGVSTPLAPIRRSVEESTRLGLMAAPVLVALVAAATWLTATRALRPVEALRRQVEATDPDALDRHVPTTGARDEIDQLAHTMNDLLDRLHGASEQRRRFVSDASHELRSPITATLATLETLPTEPAQRSAALDLVAAEQHQLARLVDDLLLLATFDEHRDHPGTDTDEVDLDEIVLAAAARPRRVPVQVRIDEPHRRPGRADLLRRCCDNLIDNAARHAASSVEVSLRTVDGRAVIRVDDDGPGIPADRRDLVFERFTRLDEARNRRDGGAGLGLAIVGDIARRHGATVRVGTAALGGARFEIDLGP